MQNIKDLSEYGALLRLQQQAPPKRRRRLALLTGGAVLGGLGATLLAPAAAVAVGAGGAAKAGFGAGAFKAAGLILGSKSLSAALGGYKGMSLAHSYFRDVQNFDFVPLTENSDSGQHQLIVINGFLSEDDREYADWREALQASDIELPAWVLSWESKRLRQLSHTFTGLGVHSLVRRNLRSLPVGLASHVADNAWHNAQVNARKAGLFLADAIRQTPDTSYSIIGHSLGARVAFYALQSLADSAEAGAEPAVQNVILMGAAQGRRNQLKWKKAATACSGQLFNCYSNQDGVLRWMYQGINAGMSRPAGLGAAPSPVINLDCSDLIASHTDWKRQLPEVLKRC